MLRFIVAFAFLLQSLSALSAADTVKIAHIDPTSGPFANVGQSLTDAVAKIKASGADTVLTGNWGNDLPLLVRAGKEAGLTTDYYALYAYLVSAMKSAQSTEPLKVAMALEGKKVQGDTGELWMRADDHQLMQPLFVSTFAKVGKGVKHDVESLGLG
jgi:branched-chain amino acid transport system substrate-binding protein